MGARVGSGQGASPRARRARVRRRARVPVCRVWVAAMFLQLRTGGHC